MAHLTRNFRVHLDGREVGFAHVSSLSSVTAGDLHQVAPVVMRRGMTTAGEPSELWQWRQEVVQEKEGARRDVVIELLDERQEAVVARWLLARAWPTRWTGPTLDADGAEVATEEIELACERLDWID